MGFFAAFGLIVLVTLMAIFLPRLSFVALVIYVCTLQVPDFSNTVTCIILIFVAIFAGVADIVTLKALGDSD